MKTFQKLLGLFALTLFCLNCSKDDTVDKPPGNKAPGNFTASATASGNSVLIKWGEAIDPDGDTVTYSVKLGDNTVLDKSTSKQFTVSGLDYDTSYSGEVIASDPRGLSSESAFSFSTDDEPNSPPEAVSLTSPVSGSTDVALTPDLIWEASTDPDGDAVSYDLYFGTEQEPAIVGTDLNETTFAIANDLSPDTTYYWKVAAKDGRGGESSSEVFSFTTKDNLPPSVFNLIAVENGADNTSYLPLFEWEAATDPEGGPIVYDLFLDTSANPTEKIAEGLSAASHQVAVELTSNTKYYWKVVAIDAQGKQTTSSIWNFTVRDLALATLVTDNSGFDARRSHTSVVFNDKMWVIGGASCCGGRYNDVWYSEDGATWTEATPNANFSARALHTSVVFDNKIWVIGGNSSYTSGSEFSDVWYSEDGVTWILATDDGDFGPRYDHRALVYDGKIWLFGGRDAANSYSNQQVWNSTNGIDWDLVTDNAGMSLYLSEFTVFNNKMWRIGNYSDKNTYSSTDGINWSLEGENTPFGQRHNHTLTVWDNKIWLISGSDKAGNELIELPDIWYSEDGATWNLAADDAGFTPVAKATSLTFNDKMWILGGGDGWQGTAVYDEVWSIAY